MPAPVAPAFVRGSGDGRGNVNGNGNGRCDRSRINASFQNLYDFNSRFIRSGSGNPFPQ